MISDYLWKMMVLCIVQFSVCVCCVCVVFFVQAEDGIRDLVRSRGLGDVYKRQVQISTDNNLTWQTIRTFDVVDVRNTHELLHYNYSCLLYTSDAADERSSVDLGGRRIIKKKTKHKDSREHANRNNN